ncbi:MAG: GerW family sporulation protein [Clostridia bacterium]|nr:GerW family sporulation protein [Clostridia bacterium]
MAENKHPIEGIMYTALEGLKGMIDVNTIVGDAITTPDGTVIIPISKVAIGFGVGGSKYEKFNKSGKSDEAPKNMFGGATGGGISLTPEAFLVVGNGKIRMISVTPQNSIYDRLLDFAPEAIDKVADLFNRKKDIEVTPEDLDEEDFEAQNPDA